MRGERTASWLVVLLVFLSVFFSNGLLAANKISENLIRALSRGDQVLPVILVLQDKSVMPMMASGDLTPYQKIRMLQQYRTQSQRDIRQVIKQVYSDYYFYSNSDRRLDNVKFYWIVNAVRLRASRAVLRELVEREDVKKAFYDMRVSIPDRSHVYWNEVTPDDSTFKDDYTYGLKKIGIPELRAKRAELNGEGVVVGVIDTGIDASHPELQGKLLRFKDFASQSKDPIDDHGHGTHVSCTIAGFKPNSTAIGIAPKVRILMAKGFDSSGSSSTSILLDAMEWMTDPDGDPKTNDMPSVVNNSWGGDIGDDSASEPFWDAVAKWVDLNIFPSFAAGNSGPDAQTVGRPGGYPHAFAVGATDENDEIASFSSRGPVIIKVKGETKTIVKPDVSAPGVDILSCLPNNKYAKWSGTSMATPHVTGVIALLRQLNPKATVADIRRILEETSQDLGDGGKDNAFGSGRINAVKAAEAVMALRGLR